MARPRGRPPGRPAARAAEPRPLSSAEVAAKLKARFPCRDEVIEELLDVLVGSEGGVVFFEGPASTGKTAILRSALSLLGARHAFVDCISCPDARSIARSIASQLGGSTSVRAVSRGADGEEDPDAPSGADARGPGADGAGGSGAAEAVASGGHGCGSAPGEVGADSGAGAGAAPSAAAALSALLAELPRLAQAREAGPGSLLAPRTAWIVLDEAHRLAGTSLLEALCQLPEAAPGALGLLAVSRLAPGSGAFLGPPGADLARTLRVPAYGPEELQAVLLQRLRRRIPELVREMAARRVERGAEGGTELAGGAGEGGEPPAWASLLLSGSPEAVAALSAVSARLSAEHLPRFLALFCPSFARASNDLTQAERAAQALFPRYVEPVLEGAGGGPGPDPGLVLAEVAPGALLRRIRESLRAVVAAGGAGGALRADGPRRRGSGGGEGLAGARGGRPPLPGADAAWARAAGPRAATVGEADRAAWRRAVDGPGEGGGDSDELGARKRKGDRAPPSAIQAHELEPSEDGEEDGGEKGGERRRMRGGSSGAGEDEDGVGREGDEGPDGGASSRPPAAGLADAVGVSVAPAPAADAGAAVHRSGAHATSISPSSSHVAHPPRSLRWFGWSRRFPPCPPPAPPATSAAPPPPPPAAPAELPRTGRLLAVASYVASRVPAKKDRATFDPSLKARRKRLRPGDDGAGDGGINDPSQLPKPFAKERLLAIFYVLHSAAGEPGEQGAKAAFGTIAPPGPLEACSRRKTRPQAARLAHASSGRSPYGPTAVPASPAQVLARSALDAEVQSTLATLCALRLVAPATRADGEGVGDKTLVARLTPQQAEAMAKAEGIRLADYLTVSA